MPALAGPVSRIFDKVAALTCVSDYLLVGGTNPVPISANLRAADLLAIAAMKMEVLMRRAAFRDYYDIYSLFKQGVDLNDAIELALKYSKHQMKRKNLLAILCNGNRFLKSDDFQLLLPVYDVTADEIAAFMSDKINSTFFTPPALP